MKHRILTALFCGILLFGGIVAAGAQAAQRQGNPGNGPYRSGEEYEPGTGQRFQRREQREDVRRQDPQRENYRYKGGGSHRGGGKGAPGETRPMRKNASPPMP